MKELSVEEKAQAYDKAIKRAESVYNETTIPSATTKGICTYIFPELAESEDERIRKAIGYAIGQSTHSDGTLINGVSSEEALAWLEKQGEQKATIIIPKFRVGDEIKTSNEESLTITKIDEKGYWSEDLFICGFDDAAKWELVEQKPVWSEKYIADVFEKVGLAKIVREQSNDNLTNALQDAMIELSKFIPQSNHAWSEEDERHFSWLIEHLSQSAGLYDNLIVWLESLKDRVQPQPKQEWREEDEKIWKEISDMLWEGYTQSCSNFTWDDIRDWVNPKIKSIRSQNAWKPSDEQIKVCKEVYADILSAKGFDLGTVNSELNRLEEELKKLKA